MQSRNIAVIDFETTGLSPWAGARAIEIGVVLISGQRVVDRFQSLMNPRVRVPAEISQLTGITNQMVSGAPPSITVMRDAAKFIGDADLVAHNAAFDRKFMEAEMAAAGVARPLNFACTLLLSRRIFRDAPNHRLETLVRHLKLPTKVGFHRALADAQATAELLLRIQAEISERFGIDHVHHDFMAKIQKTSARNLEKLILGAASAEASPMVTKPSPTRD